MPLDYPKAGLNYATEFQISGLPYVTSSFVTGSSFTTASNMLIVNFPYVAKHISVYNYAASSGSYLRVGFTSNGVFSGGNYFKVPGGGVVQEDLRIKSLFIMCDGAYNISCSVLAGLTNIPNRFMPVLTGTLPDGSSSWDGVG